MGLDLYMASVGNSDKDGTVAMGSEQGVLALGSVACLGNHPDGHSSPETVAQWKHKLCKREVGGEVQARAREKVGNPKVMYF